jgi:hypothetical protein
MVNMGIFPFKEKSLWYSRDPMIRIRNSDHYTRRLNTASEGKYMN